MVNIVPVERARHGNKGWRRLTGFGFVAGQTVAPLSGSEFSQAAPAMPIGFVERSGTYLPVALMAVKKGNNVFVGPSGQWLGDYLPAVLRSYPFSLLRGGNGSEQRILAIDEDSGMIVDEIGEGVDRFFEPDGTPSQTTKALTDFLQLLERDQALTQNAVAPLAEADVIKPWPLTVPIGGNQVTVSGLHRVDEAALNALDDATFLKLRKAGSLVVGYGQIISMTRVNVLTKLSHFKEQITPAPPTP